MLDRETVCWDSGVCGARLGRVVMSQRRLAAPVVAMYAAGPVGPAWLAPRPRGDRGAGVRARVDPAQADGADQTDGRDGERPARLVAAGELDVVRVPAPWEERYPDAGPLPRGRPR